MSERLNAIAAKVSELYADLMDAVEDNARGVIVAFVAGLVVASVVALVW